MADLEADCLKTDRGPMVRKGHKAEFAGGGCDAMQVKGRIWSFIEQAHFEMELQGKLQRV